MHIEDPNTTPPAEPVSTEAEVAAAMDAGIAAASEPATPAEPPAAATPPAAEAPAAPAAPAATPVDPPVPGTPEAAAAAAATPLAAAPAPDADTEKEIKDLGITNEKTQARFREMAGELKTLAPVKAALDAAGIKDVADLPALVKRAEDGQFLLEQVQSVATPEQFGQTMDYLGLVSKAGQGDRVAAEQAFDLIQGEYLALAKALGREVPGVHDPLAEHPDLQADVEKGEVTRARALELAQARAAQKTGADLRARNETVTRQQAEQQQALDNGKAALNAVQAELMAADPQYQAKHAALVEKVKGICRDFPPAQWAAATRLAYAAITAPAVAPVPPATPPANNSALRPGGPRPAIVPAVYDDPNEAMEAGIAAASAGR